MGEIVRALKQLERRLKRWIGLDKRFKFDFSADLLAVRNHNLDFMADPRFIKAWEFTKARNARGWQNGVPDVRWRLHTAIWAAGHAAQLPGDFVECGVHTGIFSLGICDYLDFDTLGKKFWLLDTFNGIPVETLTTEEERVLARAHNENIYFDCYAVASENFAPFKNCHLVRGTIPQSLADVPSEQISYLHIDLNNAEPEAAALEYFWPKLVSGGIVLLDDYGWSGHRRQKDMIDEVAKRFGVSALTLPTGQGMILKP